MKKIESEVNLTEVYSSIAALKLFLELNRQRRDDAPGGASSGTYHWFVGSKDGGELFLQQIAQPPTKPI